MAVHLYDGTVPPHAPRTWPWSRMRLVVLLIALVPITIGAAACSGGGGGPAAALVTSAPTAAGAPPASTATAASGPATPGGAPTAQATTGTMTAMLALVPDTPGTQQAVSLVDYERLRQVRNVPLPADYGDKAQRAEYLARLFTNPVLPGTGGDFFLGGAAAYSAASEHPRYLGFKRVDQEVLAGEPPNTYQAVRGQFDPASAERAIAGCRECPPPERGTAQGVPYYAWGNDFEVKFTSVLSPPAFDQLGRGGRIAVTDQVVLRTLWTDGLTQMIAAFKGGASLAKNEDARLAATALDAAGAYSAYLTSRTQGPAEAERALAGLDGPQRDAVAGVWRPDPAANVPVLQPYRYLAAGLVVDRSGEVSTVLVLVHGDERAATANADLLKRRVQETSSVRSGKRWSETIPSVQTRVDGRVLIATLKGSRIGSQFLFVSDPLLLHR